MIAEDIIQSMRRELNALGQYYRNDWSDFDGRTLRSQLNQLTNWSIKAIDDKVEDFTEFTELLEDQSQERGY